MKRIPHEARQKHQRKTEGSPQTNTLGTKHLSNTLLPIETCCLRDCAAAKTRGEHAKNGF